MATPYFTSGDAAAGADAFAAGKWKEARTAFEAARKTATGETAARLVLLLGLTNEQLGSWAVAADQLASARKGLPLLSDYNRETVKAYGIALDNFAGLPGYLACQRAVFALDKDGVVRYVEVTANPGVEPNYAALAEALAKF